MIEFLTTTFTGLGIILFIVFVYALKEWFIAKMKLNQK